MSCGRRPDHMNGLVAAAHWPGRRERSRLLRRRVSGDGQRSRGLRDRFAVRCPRRFAPCGTCRPTAPGGRRRALTAPSPTARVQRRGLPHRSPQCRWLIAARARWSALRPGSSPLRSRQLPFQLRTKSAGPARSLRDRSRPLSPPTEPTQPADPARSLRDRSRPLSPPTEPTQPADPARSPRDRSRPLSLPIEPSARRSRRSTPRVRSCSRQSRQTRRVPRSTTRVGPARDGVGRPGAVRLPPRARRPRAGRPGAGPRPPCGRRRAPSASASGRSSTAPRAPGRAGANRPAARSAAGAPAAATALRA